MGILRILAKHLLCNGDDGSNVNIEKNTREKTYTHKIQVHCGIVGKKEENLLMMMALTSVGGGRDGEDGRKNSEITI